ncbi:hypothetical protein A2856_03245 [Candidatus Uhrbacteria bacterium RIFCSPHIGHO2_01_FULL_63_20]|uniref:Uncharacterized protein n=1 Tax=Candidatus Uhrbacteria bacterium RIFCSPHIGHO2_01_FULL_63_20 TaxID=1802385 RepID=A0A1F7TLA6_9BACT|nr:MAG: hypothetical protein A2856_03245 [Candidatus Uhrbacteria bacterium RIFCSPHIGHO2_01_FULL_63_20]
MIPSRLPHAVVLVSVAIAVGSLAVGALPDPDRHRAVSDDGRLAVEWRGSDGASIARVSDARTDGFTAYLILSGGLPIHGAFTLTFSSASDWAPSRFGDVPLALWGYDPSVLAWRRASSVEDASTGMIEAEGIPGIDRWMPAPRDPGESSPQTPVLLDALLSFPPPGAVGFTASAAVAPDADAFFLVDDSLANGGCGGLFHPGRERTLTSREVVSDDRSTRVTVAWELADGCAENQPLSTRGVARP